MKRRLPRLPPIAAFVVGVGALYLVLVALWPVVRPGYRAFYCGLGNLLFEGGAASARFEPTEPDRRGHDVHVTLRSRQAPRTRGDASNKSLVVGYLPTAALVALVLATPISWHRRRWALLQGLLLVHVFVALRMWLPLIRDFSQPNALQVYEPGTFTRRLLALAERALLDAPAAWFIGPILIWALVAFRAEDWKRAADETTPAAE